MKLTSLSVSIRIGLLVFVLGCGAALTAHAQQATAVLTDPKQLSVDLGGGVKMEFVLIRPGTFQMGSAERRDGTPHKVTITKPYYIGKYEVTQEQWLAVMGNNPSLFKGPKNPVETVSWDDCQNFLAKLNKKFATQKFSLPTEAQWEYACRAGSTGDYCFGNDERYLGVYAWVWPNSDDTTHPVGNKKPNAWGLYDMHGNVSEWCADWYANYQGSAETDPTGPASGSVRIVRGGSCSPEGVPSAYSRCRSTFRSGGAPSGRGGKDGLRVVVVAR